MRDPRYEVRIFWSAEDGVYIAQVSELEGCITHGDTYEAALAHAREAMSLWLDVARRSGDPIPRPRRRSAVA
jgi:predicted RNase H-like HicB family nuclease